MNIRANHLPTAELQALDAAHHLHPFTDEADLTRRGARIITGAKGAMLIDSDGQEILDGMAGLWCTNIGHGRMELAEAAYAQMQQLAYYNTFFMTSHPPVIALAEKIAQIAPGPLNHVFFASGGSEANDTNIRLVRHYWASQGKPEKSVIIARKNGYHGSSMGSASLGGMQAMHAQGGLPIADIVHIDQPDWYAEGGDSDPAEFGLERARQLEAKIDELGEGRVAAFIAEPIQGAGGVIVPPETYWPEIQRICDEREILLIVDEVITGFGRTGDMFATEGFNLRPDVMTIAKGLSSGYAPIGGSVVTDAVAGALTEAGEFSHGYTYSGHPTSCAVALENLRIIEEEGIVEKLKSDTGPYFAARWRELSDHALVGEASVRGMMASVALSPDKGSRAAFADSVQAGRMCRDRAMAGQLIMRAVGDRMVVAPPLILSRSEIDLLIDRVTRALDATRADLVAQGAMGG